MDVSVIIVNYNTVAFLYRCLDSILQYSKNIEFEVIVVDNNSTQREIETLPVIYPAVKFLFRNVNDGFGSGCNFGAQKANGKYLLFVNPDVIFKSDVIFLFFKYMEGNIDICLCSGLHEDENGELIYSFNYFPDFRSELREAFYVGYNKHIRSLLSKKEIELKQPFEIDYALGALLFVRKTAFESINGFDERFFLYGEDIDFGYRLKKLGKIICIPNVRVFHFYNSSVKHDSGKHIQTYHLNRSKMIYMYKHYNFFQRNFTRILMITGTLLRLMYLPFNKIHKNNRLNDFNRILNGMFVFFKKYDINSLGKYYASYF